MKKIKEGISSKGELMHYSVGAVIEKNGKYLLIDRALLPSGFACVAGHVDEGESIEVALDREVEEEIGLKVIEKEKIFEGEMEDNQCVKRASVHYWYVFKCGVEGDVFIDLEEVKSVKWFTKEEIKGLKLEMSWNRLFKEIGILD
jgi:ADP-ribose pyrophosphatase YjhB (NUDIX family)